ncbi:MAG: hypothetical protein FWB80_07340 [Defluviitaleaceae bacterium]|nr:hypothetical protein [Defluviitaleaceae bacterium]
MKNNTWQPKAKDTLEKILSKFSEIKKIEAKGSLLDENMLDFYSDVDLEIYLYSNAVFDLKKFVSELSEQFGMVFGYEIHRHRDNDTLRICLQNGWRFDLSFIYPGEKEVSPEDDSFESKIDGIVNSFWFLSSMVLAKLGRGDYLVASHLALEMCQLTIIMQMLIRDRAKNTSIHRFGDRENVPVLHSLAQILGQNDEGLIRDMLLHAAECMDNIASDFGHAPREKILAKMTENLII